MSRKKKYSGMKLARRNRRFWCAYSVLLIVVFVFFWQLIRFVDARLLDYEQSQPKYTAQTYARVFTERDFATLYLNEDPQKIDGVTQQQYVAYAEEATGGCEIKVREAYSADENIRSYNVYAGDTRFASFSIRKTGELSKYGYDTWTFNDLHTQLVNKRTYIVRASEKAIVFINGQAAGEDTVSKQKVETEYSPHMQSGVTPIYDREYTFTSALAEPAIVVTDDQGNRLNLTYTNGVYVADGIYDDEILKDTHAALAEEVVRMIARYSLHLTTQYDVSSYMLNKSEAFESITKFNNVWSVVGKRMRLENVVTDKYMKFDDANFAVDVHCTLIATVEKQDDFISELGYRLYFTQRKDKWLLYYFEML